MKTEIINSLKQNELLMIAVIVVLALILFFMLPKIVEHSMIFFVDKRNKRKRLVLLKSYCNIISTILKLIVVIVAFFLILVVFNVKITVIVTSAGFIGVLITYIFQDPIKDITSGMFLVFNAPFDVGDSVEVGGFVGKITEIQSRYIVVKNYVGDICIINNRAIDKVVVLNKKIVFKKVNK